MPSCGSTRRGSVLPFMKSRPSRSREHGSLSMVGEGRARDSEPVRGRTVCVTGIAGTFRVMPATPYPGGLPLLSRWH